MYLRPRGSTYYFRFNVPKQSGANKYSRGGFLEVDNGVERYSDAMMRHYLKEGIEEIDPDSGLPHDYASAWNALARLQLRLMEERNDG